MSDKNPRKKMKSAQPHQKAAPVQAPPTVAAIKKGLNPQPKKGGKH